MKAQHILTSSHLSARHLPFDGLRHALGRMLTQGILFALLAALLTETVAIVSARTWPSAPTHWIALLIGLLMGYAAIVTVALLETVRGIVSSLERFTEELEKLASHTLHDAEALLHLSDREVQSQPVPSVTVTRKVMDSGESSIILGDLLTDDISSSSHRPAALVLSGES
jgi:hypothetical protein